MTNCSSRSFRRHGEVAPFFTGVQACDFLHHPPSASLDRAHTILYRMSSLICPRFCSLPTASGAKRPFDQLAGQ